MTIQRILILVAVLSMCYASATAQKVKTRITRREEKNIYAQAEATLNEYQGLLNFVSEPINTSSELDEAINNAFITGGNSIFFQNDFEVEDDSDPEPASEPVLKVITSYLQQFHNYYHQAKENSIRLQITDKTKIRIGKANLFLKVYFDQYMNGTTNAKKRFPKKISKVAEMQVLLLKGQYQTLISHIGYQSGKDGSADAATVTIIDGDDEPAPSFNTRQFSEEYYRQQLRDGIRLSAENNFTAAFYALKEAQQNKATEEDAGKHIQGLLSKMRDKNINVEPTEYLFKHLTSSAQDWLDKYRYDMARKYYDYARVVKPANAKAIADAMHDINEREAKEDVLWGLFEKGSYNEAASGFRAALKNNSDNPGLYIGLARSSEQLNKTKEAEDAFTNAIKVDPEYPETYKWQGYFYKKKKDYPRAHNAFVNYQTRAEDADDKAILSEIAYCKGMLLLSTGTQQQALESFTTAVGYNSANKEAGLAWASLLIRQGDLKAAGKLLGDILMKDDQFAEGHHLQGKMFEIDNKKEKAIEAYKIAIKYNKDSAVWYFDLGKLQAEYNDKADNAAIESFTACIGIRTRDRSEIQYQAQAYWKRGKCYYLQNKDDDAESDFKVYLSKPGMVPDAFYVDYANVLIRKRYFDDAMSYLKKARETPNTLLSLGVLNYLRYPSNKSGYTDYFERALRDGVNKEAVQNAPNIRMIFEDKQSGLRSLLKRYKYSTSF